MKFKLRLPIVHLLVLTLLFGSMPLMNVNTVMAQEKGFPHRQPLKQKIQTQKEQQLQTQKGQADLLQQKALDAAPLSEKAAGQIESLLKEKGSRTPTERKISSALLYTLKQNKGSLVANNVSTLKTGVMIDSSGDVLVNIKGNVTEDLTTMIEKVGGTLIYASKEFRNVRARVPMSSIEDIASMNEVVTISSIQSEFKTNRTIPSEETNQPSTEIPSKEESSLIPKVLPRNNFETRAEKIRSQVSSFMTTQGTGAVVTEGDRAHEADRARNFFGVNGTGVRIGVLSDSVRFLPQSQSTGDLPPDVTVIPGEDGIQADGSDAGEGTAMLEIIHDLAPGAKLYFATAFNGPESFADNIRRLRTEYKCDIIVDDVIYFAEPAFEDGPIAQAVNDVTDNGALYFSSAGNEGNFNDGTTGTWEGDFKNGGRLNVLGNDYKVNNFGAGVISNRVLGRGGPVVLNWSDKGGESSNDYDLFLLNGNLTQVLAASTDIQDGTQDPIEFLGVFAPVGSRLVIAKANDAAPRALNLISFGGILGLSTPGAVRGHAAARNAYAVAAIDVAVAANNGGVFTSGNSNQVEPFSSDGYRRVFYNPDGSAITPDNFLFRTRGGELRKKPEITAADGVKTTVPVFFNPFFGTSAAAPHAAAIAGLIKSAQPSYPLQITPELIRFAFSRSSLDIEARGYDRDSGYGVLNAFQALSFLGVQRKPTVNFVSKTVTPFGGDGDEYIEPGESAQIKVKLQNVGGATARNITAELTTSTPGVTILTPNSNYPNLAPNAEGENQTPFIFTLANDAPCGLSINFTLKVTYNGQTAPQSFNFTVQTGAPGSTATSVDYTGPVVPIPDNSLAGVDIPVEVSGVGSISNLKFLIGGDACSADAGATGVGIDHTYTGDLILTLKSPQGTSVTLINGAGGSGNNYCQTLLDDSATTPIQSITSIGQPPLGPPHTGTFKPASPLSAFNGENPNGTWTLNVRDRFFTDTGNVRAFSIQITPFECN